MGRINAWLKLATKEPKPSVLRPFHKCLVMFLYDIANSYPAAMAKLLLLQVEHKAWA